MGYCYTNDGQLCCDICGAAGARKYRCPFGYCPAIAACPKCRKDRAELFGRAAHRKAGCEAGHNQFQAELDERKALLLAGLPVRCSALGGCDPHGNDRVHVLFKRQDGSCEGWYMPRETYHALPLGNNTTPDDYRKHGHLEAAPDDFGSGRTTKQVILT